MGNPIRDWKDSRRADRVEQVDGVEAVTAYGPVRDAMEARHVEQHLDTAATEESQVQEATSTADAEYLAGEEWEAAAASFHVHNAISNHAHVTDGHDDGL